MRQSARGLATWLALALIGPSVFACSGSSEPVTNTTAPPPGQLAIATQPGGAVSGVNLVSQPVVQIRDASNALVSTSTSAVTAAIASGTGTLVGTTTINAVSGVATFTNLRINGAGAHTLTFTANGVSAATSASFTVTQAAGSLSIQTQPVGATSGAPMPTQPVIRILDNAGLLLTSATQTVTAAMTSGNGTVISGGSVNAVAGIATFTVLRVDGTGPQVLTFSTTQPPMQVVSTAFAVNAAGATHLSIRTQPNGAVSGVNLTTQPVFELLDANNVIVGSSTASVLAEIASGTGTLIGNTTVTAVNGVATFTNLRINGVGAHTLKFTAIGLPAVTSQTLTVTQTPASLSIQTQPASSVNGAPLMVQPVIRVLDNAGLVVVSFNLPVTATIASGTGTVAGGGSVAASNGIASFTTLRIDGTGPVTLIFSIATPALQTVPSQPFAVNAAPP